MKRITLILAGALAVQLALAFGLTFSGSDNAAFEASEPLLAFDPKAVDAIAIDESGADPVTLKKAADGWQVPSLAGFPADSQRVGHLLDKLAGLKKGWPVATSSDAAQRFKLTDKSHERRIVLSGGGKQIATLLVGASPAMRQVYVRNGDDGTIYSAAMAAYDASARGEEWMDRGFLGIPQDKIASISIGDVTLERKDGKFILAGIGENEQPVESEIARLAQMAARPAFDVVQGKGAEEVAKLEPADIQLTVKRDDGTAVTYKFKKEANGGAYLFASSAHDYVFRVAEGNIAPIAQAARAKLVKAKEQPAAEAPQTPQGPEPPASGAEGG
jgi:hypothetical protein